MKGLHTLNGAAGLAQPPRHHGHLHGTNVPQPPACGGPPRPCAVMGVMARVLSWAGPGTAMSWPHGAHMGHTACHVMATWGSDSTHQAVWPMQCGPCRVAHVGCSLHGPARRRWGGGPMPWGRRTWGLRLLGRWCGHRARRTPRNRTAEAGHGTGPACTGSAGSPGACTGSAASPGG